MWRRDDSRLGLGLRLRRVRRLPLRLLLLLRSFLRLLRLWRLCLLLQK